MGYPRCSVALLSKAQIDAFRSQLASRREAEFLGPQLLEHISILTRDLQAARATLDALRSATSDLTVAFDRATGTAKECQTCRDARLKAALLRFRTLLEA